MALTPALDWVVNAKEPEVEVGDGRALGGIQHVLHEPDHEHLTDPLRLGHRARVRSTHEASGVDAAVQAGVGDGVALADAVEGTDRAADVAGDAGALGVAVAEHPAMIRIRDAATRRAVR